LRKTQIRRPGSPLCGGRICLRRGAYACQWDERRREEVADEAPWARVCAVNLWLRLARVWLMARRRSPLGLRDVSVIRLRAWPHDLDFWGHVNGGRFLTMSDLGRFDLFVRAGFFRVARREGWVLPIGAAAVRFRRPLRLFQRVEMHTRVLGWDDRWGYLRTEFFRGDKVIATVVVRGLAQNRARASVSMNTVFARLGWDEEPMPVPAATRAWVDAEGTATR